RPRRRQGLALRWRGNGETLGATEEPTTEVLLVVGLVLDDAVFSIDRSPLCGVRPLPHIGNAVRLGPVPRHGDAAGNIGIAVPNGPQGDEFVLRAPTEAADRSSPGPGRLVV